MVAVSLSEEVRPLPLPMPMPATVEEQEQVGGTGHAATTGIESVDDHIARLKANARQHVDRELRGGEGNTKSRRFIFPFPTDYWNDLENI